MKNRRLNVLFVAIIALAAAPQALDDARHLMNSAQERIEAGFWNTFLSYRERSIEAGHTSPQPELIAAVRPLDGEDCLFESEASTSAAAVRNASRTIENPAPAQGRANPSRDNRALGLNVEEENFDFNFEKGDEPGAPQPVELTEQDKKAFRVAGLHALYAARVSDEVAKAAIASSLLERDEQLRTRMRRETDKLTRPKVRYLLDKGEVKTEAPMLRRSEGI